MSRPRSLLFVAVVSFCSLLPAADGKKPNIVFIVGDDMGYADVGFQGCQDIPTPQPRRAGQGGVRCTNGYVSGPYCSPTRAGLLTGRYQTRFGHEFNAGDGPGHRPAADGNDDRRPAQSGGLRHGPGRQVASRQRAEVPSAEARLRRVLRLPRRCARLLPDDARHLSAARSRSTRRNTSPTPSAARPSRSSTGTRASRSSSTSRSTPSTRRCRPTDPRLKKFAHIADERRRTYAAMMSAMDEAVGSVPQKLDETGARAKHARHVHQRQRRPDDAGDDDQRFEQRPTARLQADDARGGHPRAVPRLLAGARANRASMTSR